jgi:hypothetical protein
MNAMAAHQAYIPHIEDVVWREFAVASFFA